MCPLLSPPYLTQISGRYEYIPILCIRRNIKIKFYLDIIWLHINADGKISSQRYLDWAFFNAKNNLEIIFFRRISERQTIEGRQSMYLP